MTQITLADTPTVQLIVTLLRMVNAMTVLIVNVVTFIFCDFSATLGRLHAVFLCNEKHIVSNSI